MLWNKPALLTLTMIVASCLILLGSGGTLSAQGLPPAMCGVNAGSGQMMTGDAFFPHDKRQAAVMWAEALKERNGSFRYALLSGELKDQEFESYRQNHWVIGGSSPHVVSYTVEKTNELDEDACEYDIRYVMTDSTRTLYDSQEKITVRRMGRSWFVVQHDDYQYMPPITVRTNG